MGYPKKPRKLRGIKLAEVSAVDTPADPRARIALFKRADEAQQTNPDNDGGCMTPEELAATLEAMEGQVADLTKSRDEALALVDAFEAAALEAGLDVTKADGTVILEKRADPEMIEIGGEMVEKSALPAAVIKTLEAQAEEIAKAKAAQANADLEKRGAEVLPNLRGTNLAKGKLVAAIGDDQEMLETLKAADAALKRQMEEIGANPSADESSATYRLNKMAADYAAEKGVPFEVGYSEVTKSGEGRDLMNAARAEAN